MLKPFIYVASPYTKGDPCINTNFQMRIWDRLVKDGVVDAYVPLWSHFQHTSYPQPYTVWIEYDKAIIPRLDGVLRLNAEIPELGYFEDKSSGADGEVALAESLGQPTWFSLQELYTWAQGRARQQLETAVQRSYHDGVKLNAGGEAEREYYRTVTLALQNVLTEQAQQLVANRAAANATV